MKCILFFLLLLLPDYSFAQNDTIPTQEVVPNLTLNVRRSPMLAGMLSYFVPGAGQIYNKQYEKALGIVSVMAYSMVMMTQAIDVRNEQMAIASGFGFAGAWAYSFVDAILAAQKINYELDLKLDRTRRLSLKPDFQLSQKPVAYGASGYEPVLGLRLKLSL